MVLFPLKNKKTKLKWGTKSANYKGRKTNGSRRVYIEMWANSIAGMRILRDVNGLFLGTRVNVDKEFVVIVRNHKRSFGRWHSYKTRCKFYDIQFETNHSNGVWTHSGRESSDNVNNLRTTFIFDENVYNYAPNKIVPNYNPVQPIIYMAKGKATNQGVGYSNYAYIDEN